MDAVRFTEREKGKGRMGGQEEGNGLKGRLVVLIVEQKDKMGKKRDEGKKLGKERNEGKNR